MLGSDGLREMGMLTDLISIFPKLATEPYRRTSDCTFDYNCFAHALDDQTQRWEPAFSWPDGLPKTAPPTIAVLMRLFRMHGYQPCGGPDAEQGFEKVAIYGKGNKATHAAKQLPDGSWTSKLGDLDDISHTLEGLVGDMYGRPLRYMKRPVAAPANLPP